MGQWFRNGKPVDSVAIDDRGFQYGDGLFETIAIRNGEARLMTLHLERLAKGCKRLGIKMPDVDELTDSLAKAVRHSHEIASYCVAKIIVSSGVGQRGYGRALAVPGSVAIGVFPARPVAAAAYRNGVDTIICETRLALHSPTAGLKTLNRLEQVLGRSECLATSAFEGLSLDAEERLICGTMSNVFIVAKKSIITPLLERCGVEGVMRRFVIESLSEQGMDVEIRDITMAELRTSDEVFLTNSQFGALPVRQCGEQRWPTGDITYELLKTLADSGIEECAA